GEVGVQRGVYRAAARRSTADLLAGWTGTARWRNRSGFGTCAARGCVKYCPDAGAVPWPRSPTRTAGQARLVTDALLAAYTEEAHRLVRHTVFFLGCYVVTNFA